MRRMLALFTAEMIRPTIYRSVTKCAVTLTLVLLWDRYVSRGMMSVTTDGCFVAALILFGLAWLCYLRLDGITPPKLLTRKKRGEEEEEARRRRHFTRDIVDYADEHIVPFDELSDEEQLACSMACNLISGVIFLIPAVVGLVMGAI